MAKKKSAESADLVLAREAAAKAQANADVATMIRSGDYDAWPNVQAALNAIAAVRAA
ncbi:hypothetical protein [Devosia riboflavina]|uniref:hypothetical protein n=1 Tax=Devosia riboflavina TaxID=46914 RepID=UPI0013628FAB|nr:hypothetical protein [Devosia riboflavina]